MKNILIITIAAALVGCGQQAETTIKLPDTVWSMGQSKTCVASWYGEKYRGRTTASGTTFNPDELSVAHKSLPFGTRLLVENGPNRVFVTVTDRGPYIEGRELDLSRAAFEKLAQKEAGLITVKYTILNKVTHTHGDKN